MKKTKKLNRRDFIKLSSIASASLPIALSGFPLFANNKPKGFQFSEDNENILVLVQLQGGNDGLNTIFDLNQYSNLQSVRSNIIIPQNNLISVNSTTSFHPSMTGLKDLWDKENLGIIQNVGYPDQNRSHFRSTDIWNSASDANEYISTGWIGRFLDIANPDFPINYPNTENPHPFAITIGKIVSETCQGKNSNFSLAINDPNNPGTAPASTIGEIPNNCYGDALTFVNETISQTNAYADTIKNAANAGNNLSDKYDNIGRNQLAEKLKNVAKLISGGLKTKIFVVQLGGFDNHNNQVVDGDSVKGVHSDLLTELSDAICAFQDDIEKLGIDKKIIGMTYSEFGRRIRSNAGFGTDHGTAAPMFLFGNCAKNQILGDAPEIDTQVDINEGVQMQYDFRDVYRSVITDWLGGSEADANTVLFNDFSSLPIFKEGCSAALTSSDFEIQKTDIEVFPNPSSDFIQIRFLGSNQNVQIKLYNSIGAVVKEITNQNYSAIQHTLRVDIKNLPRGNYFVHYKNRGISKTKKLLKY